MRDQFFVLVVEDNEANQLLARCVLEREGYRVEVAGAADEALEKVGKKPPNLILMDIQLPGQDGLSLTRQLKKSPTTADIPIIALTADAMIGDREATIAAGCAGYIAKPIDTRRLGDQIREILAPASVE
ncbi:MAG TPA: response regulator [Candidatus Eisenbacteria bacterium]|nr:response regulator [Candidatus Eisenbacteria bacterium]